MKILIDNGNGLNTLGKRSPDGTLIEAAYTREIGRRIVSDLTDRGYDAELLVPEDEDISLSERVKRVNAISSSCPAQTGHLAPNVILISIHINAAGNGSKWTNATGWSVYTCKGQTASDHLADCLCQAAIKKLPRQTHPDRLLRRRSRQGRKLLYPTTFPVSCSTHRKLLYGRLRLRIPAEQSL